MANLTPMSIDIDFARRPVIRVSRPATWTARCKSGYQFNGRVCKRLCSRGELLCSDCANAQAIPTVAPDGLLARVAAWLDTNQPYLAVAGLAIAGILVQVVR